MTIVQKLLNSLIQACKQTQTLSFLALAQTCYHPALISSQVYDLSMHRASTLLQPTQSEHNRKGGLVIIAVLAEGDLDTTQHTRYTHTRTLTRRYGLGLQELLKPNLADLLRVVCQSTKDPSPSVRSAAAVAITQFSDYLRPEVMHTTYYLTM